MDKAKKLAKVAIEARDLLRHIGSGRDIPYDRANKTEAMARKINAALVPFVGAGAE
jgi:hypothetical protein